MLSVIFLRNMGEVTESKDAPVDETEATSEKGQASVLETDVTLANPSVIDETEMMTTEKGRLSNK